MDIPLDHIGIKHGGNKSTALSGFLPIYEKLFGHRRNEPLTLLEIGVFEGASLRTWAEFFPNAQIIGVDINPDCARYQAERTTIEIGSQGDAGFVAGLADRYAPDIVIDDGSHQWDHIIATFERLFPVVRPTGIYIVEDLHVCFGELQRHYRKGAERNPVDYFNAISSELASGAQSDVESVSFFFKGVALTKKAPRTFSAELKEYLNTHSDKPWPNFVLAREFFTNGDIHRAMATMKIALELDDTHPGFHTLHSDICKAGGLHAEAMEAARAALRLRPASDGLKRKLEALESRSGSAKEQ